MQIELKLILNIIIKIFLANELSGYINQEVSIVIVFFEVDPFTKSVKVLNIPYIYTYNIITFKMLLAHFTVKLYKIPFEKEGVKFSNRCW